MRRHDERGVALLLAILVLALLVALILEFDSEARREYREASAFRDNFKATVLTRAGVQAARAVLQMDHLKDKQTGQMYDATTDLWAFPIEKYALSGLVIPSLRAVETTNARFDRARVSRATASPFFARRARSYSCSRVSWVCLN